MIISGGQSERACASGQGRIHFFSIKSSFRGGFFRAVSVIRERINIFPNPRTFTGGVLSLDPIVIVIKWARSPTYTLSHAYDRSVCLSSRLLLISSLGFPQTKRPNPNIAPYLAPSFTPPPLSPSVLVNVTYSIRRQNLHVAGAFYTTRNPRLYYTYHRNPKTMLCGDCAGTTRPKNKLVLSFQHTHTFRHTSFKIYTSDAIHSTDFFSMGVFTQKAESVAFCTPSLTYDLVALPLLHLHFPSFLCQDLDESINCAQ